MSQASSVSGEVFQNDQLFSVLAQNPSTAKYLGQPDVCRIISELRSDPSVYATKYSVTHLVIAALRGTDRPLS